MLQYGTAIPPNAAYSMAPQYYGNVGMVPAYPPGASPYPTYDMRMLPNNQFNYYNAVHQGLMPPAYAGVLPDAANSPVSRPNAPSNTNDSQSKQ